MPGTHKKKRHITAREKEMAKLGISAEEYVKRSGSENRKWLEKRKGHPGGSNPLGIDIKSFEQQLKKTMPKKNKKKKPPRKGFLEGQGYY